MRSCRSMFAILFALAALAAGADPCHDQFQINIQRGGCQNVFKKLNAGGSATVVYLGGSVTQADGWRVNVGNWLGGLYPGRVTNINSGWPGTGSAVGAGRFPTDVLAYNPDLVFIEFAVNDETGDTIEFMKRNYEGMVRQAWNSNPNMDIVFVETVAWYSTPLYTNGQLPHCVDAAYQVAGYYGIPSSNCGWDLYSRVTCDGVQWESLAPDRCHPNAAGHLIYSNAIIGLLSLDRYASGSQVAHTLPARMMAYPFEDAQAINLSQLPMPSGWSVGGGWGVNFAQTNIPGAALTFNTYGPTVDLKFIMANDGGTFEVIVDGAWLFSLNVTGGGDFVHAYPPAKNLTYGPHTVTVRHVSGGWTRMVACWYGDPVNAANETIIDNGDAVYSGSWSTGTSSLDKYGPDYRYAASNSGKTATFQGNLDAGTYEVAVWYPQGANRANNAPFTVNYNGGSQTFYVNQQANGGLWNTLGTFDFAQGGGEVVLSTDGANPSIVMADAVKFTFLTAPPTPTPTASPSPSPSLTPSPSPTSSPSPSPTPTLTPSPTPPPSSDIIVDNTAATFSGTWTTGSSATDKYGADYQYATSGSGGTATYAANLPTAGNWKVSVWYPQGANRANNAPHTVTYSSGSQNFAVNQQTNGGAWNVLGTFVFAQGGGQVVIGTTGANPSGVMADAVRFEYINSSAPTTVSYDSVAAEDGYVLESGETTEVGGSNNSANTIFGVGDYNDRRQFRGFVSFDSSAIPDGATIQSATLKLTQYSINGGDPWASLGTCTVDIAAMFGAATTLANEDFQAAATAPAVATVPKPSGNNVTVNAALDANGKGLVNKTGKTQLRVRFTTDDDNDSANDYVNFYSGNYSTNTAYRPKLEVIYLP